MGGNNTHSNVTDVSAAPAQHQHFGLHSISNGMKNLEHGVVNEAHKIGHQIGHAFDFGGLSVQSLKSKAHNLFHHEKKEAELEASAKNVTKAEHPQV